MRKLNFTTQTTKTPVSLKSALDKLVKVSPAPVWWQSCSGLCLSPGRDRTEEVDVEQRERFMQLCNRQEYLSRLSCSAVKVDLGAARAQYERSARS